ncbi:YtxH domain-containing protein [Protaetiibacter mangrovi]|uniref:YtxH domain-containing protein n=1 Tax=Protaetiibacter mangrovi TaxID=2970926 RepID=A0ABT1ZCD0_9MICO|nr:YtxH domain-containing protein [Protaetiibacter mangrovi]MCS0498367.1 YtxH domain-containing protein [Protaetiibacter mangrovi]TPW92525.1 YtxH domain-containing protein [Schumannella luteola]
MKGKILFLAGLGVGYVLGTRAGRERYEQIKAAATNLWNAPVVQKRVDDVQEFVKDKAPEVVEFVADGAKKVAAQVSGRSTAAPAKKPAARSTAAKSSTAKKSSTATKKPATGSAS